MLLLWLVSQRNDKLHGIMTVLPSVVLVLILIQNSMFVVLVLIMHDHKELVWKPFKLSGGLREIK